VSSRLPSSPGVSAREVAAALAAAAALWTVGCFTRSLWGDEFHSLHHARLDTLGELFASVRSDNHPPLSFLLLRASRALFGESQLALRLPSLLAGLAFVALVPRRAALWLSLVSSYALMTFTEARMYALLAALVLALGVVVARTLDGEPRGRWLVAPLVVAGLHTHYYFVHNGFVLALVVVALAAARQPLRPRARSLVLPALAGAAAFVPWLLWGFVEQIGHGLSPGSDDKSLARWLQSFAHLLFVNASLGGAWVTRAVALPGAAAAAVLAVAGVVRLARRASPGAVVALALAIGVPVWAVLVAWVWPRAHYNLHYVAGSLGAAFVVLGAGLGARRAASGAGLVVLSICGAVVFVTAAAVTAVNLASPGIEDYRGAIAHVLAHAEPGDALLLKPIWDLDPERSPTAWDYYAPATASVPSTYPTWRFREALEHERVWIFVRYRYPQHVVDALRASHSRHTAVPIGGVMSVHLFERAGER